jgi:hypothetical protein
MVNMPLKWMLNVVTYFMPIPVEVPIMGNYAIDLSPIYKMAIDAANAVMYMRAEIVNSGKGIQPDENTPYDLQKIQTDKAQTVEIFLNEHTFATAFSSMAKSGDLKFVITDDMVFNLTQFLHLRTADFAYFIPGLLAKYGDKKMQLVITQNGAAPKMIITQKDSSLNIAGAANVEFQVIGAESALTLIMDGELSLSAKTENSAIYAHVNGISLKDLKITASKIENPNIELMKKEFNTLFKFVVNAVNIYALETPIKLPEEIPLDIITILIKGFTIKFLDGALGVGVKLALKK